MYILSLGVAGMVNFYFFYMMGLLTVAYAVFRYFMVYKGWKWKAIGNLLGRFCLYSLLGLAISAVILLPIVMQVLGTGRMEAEYYISVLYSPGFYKELPIALVGDPACPVYHHRCGRSVRHGYHSAVFEPEEIYRDQGRVLLSGAVVLYPLCGACAETASPM